MERPECLVCGCVGRQCEAATVGGPHAFIFWPRILERGCCLRPESVRTRDSKQQEVEMRSVIGRTNYATQPDSEQGNARGSDGASARGRRMVDPLAAHPPASRREEPNWK